MDTRTRDQIEPVLHQNWNQISHNILERFTTLSKSDLDAAISVDDLVARISAKSDFPAEYVEKELNELCLVGSSATMPGQERGDTPRSGQQFASRGRPFSSYGSYGY